MNQHSDFNHNEPHPADAPGLISVAIRQATQLISSEIALAKRELKQKATRAMGGIAMIVIAGFLVLSALDVLTAAAVAALTEAGLPVSVSALIVGGVAIAIALVLYFIGRDRLKTENLTPNKSITNLRRDIETVKETGNG